MAGPTTESLATDFKDIVREMAASRSEFATFREDFAGFRGRIDAQLGFLRWLGIFTATVLVTLVGSAIWLSWHASALSLRVEGLEKSTGKVVERLDKIETVDCEHEAEAFRPIERPRSRNFVFTMPQGPSQTSFASSPHFPGRLGGVADWLVRRRGV